MDIELSSSNCLVSVITTRPRWVNSLAAGNTPSCNELRVLSINNCPYLPANMRNIYM